MSLAQLWCWPSARPQYLPLANRLKGPKHPPPALLPVDPKDSHHCTWYASQTLFELREGHRCKDMNRKHNTVCQNRNESRNTWISAYDVSVSARCKRLRHRQSSIRSSVTGDRYRRTLHPGEQCKSMIVSRMKNFRCSRVATSRKTWTAFINMAPIYSEPSLESQTLSTAVSGDKWLLLNGVVPRCLRVPECFSVSEFHFIEQSAIVRHCIIALNTVIGYNKQMVSKYYGCVCAHQENESHFVTANSGCGQKYKHFKQAIQSAMVQCRNAEAH